VIEKSAQTRSQVVVKTFKVSVSTSVLLNGIATSFEVIAYRF